MRNKQITLKYKGYQNMIQDMEYLISLGFAEWAIDPKTGEEGYRITPEGIKLFQNMKEEQNG